MNYKPYPTKKAVPSRLTRKHDRNKIFVTNKKMAKLLRKTRRQERALLQEGD